MKLNSEQENAILEEGYDPFGVKNRLETWVIDDLHYPEYRRFEDLFNNYHGSHKDYGNGYLYYKNDMQYPEDLDKEKHYHEFIKKCCETLPIKITNFKKAWGVHYKPGAYSGLHSHVPGQQLTAVLFLTTAIYSKEYPLAGNLVTLQPTNHEINYIATPAIQGNVVIMDGRVYHGTYPTINERKVFVCDFDYEKI
mgnify:CR=1 FL=1